MKAILWEMFLIWDKNVTKSLQKSIRLSTTCMSSRIRNTNMYAKYDSRGYASREHTKCQGIGICMCIRTCQRIGICMCIRTLAKPLY